MLSQQERALSPRGRPYRVALIHSNANANSNGGSEIFAIEMTRRLAEHFEVELLCESDCGPWSTPIGGIARTRSRAVFRHPLLVPLWQRFTKVPELWWEYLTSYSPCLMHLLKKPVDLIFPNNYLGGLAAAATTRAITGTPMLYTEHAGLLNNGRILARSLGFRPDHLVVFSEQMVQLARRRHPNQTVSIIPNGVDLGRFSPAGGRVEHGLPGPVVLCVASLRRTSHKRVHLAIEAVAKLPDVSLLICGTGRDQDYYESLAEKLLGAGRYRICTFTYDQMPAVYRSCDLFTLPSIDEPWGLAYLEAMACGRGVVATDDAMRQLIVGEGGLLCDVTDPDAYAQCLRQALHQDWQERAVRSANRFGWERVSLAYRDAIVDTIQTKNPARAAG
ncbi:MAG: glycosyltransferase [Aphanocapsa lilacina HA4352-LM1]|jgi:glycosyltransferase involved in cell wall biosynthesis|nr:glycosyltransferase [Aphanocapsa lilacina HA4352-LM1]